MGRLRARIAANEADREIQTHLADAERYLLKAAHSCGKVIHTHRGRSQESRRAKEAQRIVMNAISMISNIGFIHSRIDRNDRDLLSEKELSRRAREKREKRQKRSEQPPLQDGVK